MLWVYQNSSNGTTNTWSAGKVTSHITRTWQSDTLVKVFILAVLVSCFAQEWKPGLTWTFLYSSGLTHKNPNRTRRIFCFSCSFSITSFSRKHPVWQSTETRLLIGECTGHNWYKQKWLQNTTKRNQNQELKEEVSFFFFVNKNILLYKKLSNNQLAGLYNAILWFPMPHLAQRQTCKVLPMNWVSRFLYKIMSKHCF